MLIALLILPLLLLLNNGVASDDSNERIVPRRHSAVVRTYGKYPSVEFYDFIPITQTYDSQKLLKVRNKPIRKLDHITRNEKNKLSDRIRYADIKSVNYPPSYNYDPLIEFKDYEKDIFMMPKTRSIYINTPVTESYEDDSDELKTPVMDMLEFEKDIGHKTQTRRSQYVRRIRVTKNQMDEYLNKTESLLKSDNNDSTKLAQTETSKLGIHFNEESTPLPDGLTFPRRKHLRDPFVPIVESENYVFAHSGDFHYSYEGGDGTKASERGELRNSNGGAGSAVEGSFSYKDKDGNDFSLTYTADENGYRPVGAHLPTPPPIPPAIQRALDHLATKTTPEPITERTKPLKKRT